MMVEKELATPGMKVNLIRGKTLHFCHIILRNLFKRSDIIVNTLRAFYSDVDPDGSAFLWVRGSRGIKWREKQSLTNKFFGFSFLRKLYFLSLNLKKVFNLYLRFRYGFDIFFLTLDGLKSIWWFYWPGSGLDPDLDPDPHSSNFVDPDPHAINADPHKLIFTLHFANQETPLTRIVKKNKLAFPFN